MHTLFHARTHTYTYTRTHAHTPRPHAQMDLEYVKRMYMEHNQEHDAQQQFTYGAKGRKSTAQHEWRFVVGSQGVNVITWAFDLTRSEPEYTPQGTHSQTSASKYLYSTKSRYADF